MDTLLFGLLLAAALVVMFTKERWISVVAFSASFVAIALLFAHHVTSALDLSF
ncbi:MAG: DUF5993 family protein [Actinobacteria bacterium]|jgi:hypothetical protein|nr:DUF5993 family protein [Actinomycetota bacterium]